MRDLQALRRDCMKHAKRSTTLANIARIREEIKAVDADSRKATETIDVRSETLNCRVHHPGASLRLWLYIS